MNMNIIFLLSLITVGIYLLIKRQLAFNKRSATSKKAWASKQPRRLVPVLGTDTCVIELPRVNKEVRWVGK